MNLTFSAPSKTFLTGEYAVLVGGPALVLNTQPRFEFRAKSGGSGLVKGIPTGSPAMGWLKQRNPIWQAWDLEFVDPHEGRGGFGASGAQFLFAHSFTTFLQSSVERAARGLNVADVWNDYQVLTKNTGSGADILSQASGNVALVQTQPQLMAQPISWPFQDLAFTVFRTSLKVPTHLHLGEVDRTKLHPLIKPATECVEAATSGASQPFVKAFKEFGSALIALGLQTEATVEHIRKFEKQSWCLGAKGCGAMGADTILILSSPTDRAVILNMAEENGLSWAADESSLSSGLEMKWSWDAN